MSHSFTALLITQALAITAGILTIAILWVFTNTENKHRRYLGVAFVSLIISLVVSQLTHSNLLYFTPQLLPFALLSLLVFIPFSYLYIRSVLSNQSLSTKDFIHFLPFVLYLLNVTPFFLLDYAGQQGVVQLMMEQNNPIQFLNYSFIPVPVEGLLLLFHIIFAFYWLGQLRLIIGYLQEDTNDKNKVSKSMVSWLYFYAGMQFILFYPYLIHCTNLIGNNTLGMVYQTTGALFVLICTGYLFAQPKLLYGLGDMIISADNLETVMVIEADSPKLKVENTKYLSQDKVIELDQKLTLHIEQNTPYLNQGYNLKNLAEDLDVPLYILSSFINKEKGLNFNDFLNKHRIEHCKQIIYKGGWKSITLEALGYDCGFSNRNSFTSAFKKWAGQTPSEFIKNQEKTA